LISETIKSVLHYNLLCKQCVHARPAHLQHQQGIVYAATNTHCLRKRLWSWTDFIVSL